MISAGPDASNPAFARIGARFATLAFISMFVDIAFGMVM
jgi:hypothetical protein